MRSTNWYILVIILLTINVWQIFSGSCSVFYLSKWLKSSSSCNLPCGCMPLMSTTTGFYCLISIKLRYSHNQKKMWFFNLYLLLWRLNSSYVSNYFLCVYVLLVIIPAAGSISWMGYPAYRSHDADKTRWIFKDCFVDKSTILVTAPLVKSDKCMRTNNLIYPVNIATTMWVSCLLHWGRV